MHAVSKKRRDEIQNSGGADNGHKGSGTLQPLKEEVSALLWIFKNVKLSHVLDLREYMKVN